LTRSFQTLTGAVSGRPDDVLLFVASFDGVLAEYRGDPTLVRVSQSRLALLTRLQRLPGVVVAIISGRPLDDLRERVPLDDDAFFIGLHGLEIAGPEFAWPRSEVMQAYEARMVDVATRLRGEVSRIPGVRVECKGPVLALHTSEAASNDVVWSRFRLLGAAAELVNTQSVRVLRGRDVLELVPNVGSSRAEAVMAVRRCVEERYQRSAFTVYIGEDAVDDDAARAIGERGVAAVVGRRARVDCHLDSPDDVDAFMQEVILDRQPRRPSTA
jgi:trehalose 6-phosphate phosphatase